MPVYIVLGNILDVNCRRGDVEWAHSVQDAAAMVRDYTKWDDAPVSLAHFAESAVRAYKIAMTPPYGAGGDRRRRRCCRKSRSPKPTGALRDSEADDERAAAGRFRRRGGSREDAGGGRESGDRRRPRGAHAARASNCWWNWPRLCRRRVQDRRFRMNFPSAHPLYERRATSATADVILGPGSAGYLEHHAHA